MESEESFKKKINKFLNKFLINLELLIFMIFFLKKYFNFISKKKINLH
jgi:hypothetical protein